MRGKIMNLLQRMAWALLLGLVLGGTVRVEAAVIHVNRTAAGANNGTSWTNAYIDLSEAIAHTANGDEIWVAAGTYYPRYSDGDTTGAATINPDGSFVGAADATACFNLGTPSCNFSLYGGFVGTETARNQRDSAANITILSGEVGNPSSKADNVNRLVQFAAAGRTVTMDGLVIAGGYQSAGSAIRLQSTATLHLKNSLVTDAAMGIATLDDSTAGLENVVITACGYGIRQYSGSKVSVTGGIFSGNGGYGQGHIRAYDSGSLTVDQTVFCGGNYASTNDSENSPGAIKTVIATTVTNSLFTGNVGKIAGAILQWHADDPDTIIRNCTFAANATCGGYLGGNGTGAATSASAIWTCHDHTGGVSAEGDLYVYNSILWGNVCGTGDIPYLIFDGDYSGNDDDAGEANVYHSTAEGGLSVNGTMNVINTANPLYRGTVASGTWTANGSFSRFAGTSTLTAGGANLPPHTLKGLLLQPSTASDPNNAHYLQYYIVGNTATTITVYGDLSGIASGVNFEVHNYRVGAGSPVLNTGNMSINNTAAVDGGMRVLNAAADQGAYESSGVTCSVADCSSSPMLPSTSACLLTATFTGADLSGSQDVDNDIDSFSLLFESSAGTALTSGTANAIFDSIVVYRDDGSGSYDAADTTVATISPLVLTNGIQTVSLAADNANEKFQSDTTGVFHVVARLSASSGSQAVGTFRVTLLQSAATTKRPVVKESGGGVLPMLYGADISTVLISLASSGGVPAGSASIPTLNQWGMMIMCLLFSLIALKNLRSSY